MGEGTIRINEFADIDAGGVLNLDVPAMLAAMNVRDTPKNRDELCKMAAEILRQQMPDAKIVAVKRDGSQN